MSRSAGEANDRFDIFFCDQEGNVETTYAYTHIPLPMFTGLHKEVIVQYCVKTLDVDVNDLVINI